MKPTGIRPTSIELLVVPMLIITLLVSAGLVRAQAPLLGSLQPAVGPTAGGSAGLLLGSGFQNGATVMFGSQPGGSVQWVNASVIFAVTPPAAGLGTVDVTVTNPDGQSAVLSNGFSYACVTGAGFTPVALTPDSYSFQMVVPASYPVLPANAAVNVTMDGGPHLNGNTWYEQGTDLSAPATGMPPAGTMLVDQARPDHQFLLPPSWLTNNCFFIGNYPGFATASLAPVTPMACSSLSFLNSSGNGPANLTCTITHADGTTETTPFTSLDWFNNATAAFSAQGRLSLDGSGSFNRVNYPAGTKLFSTDVPLANTTSPVTLITFSWNSGGRAAIFSVSASTGAGFTPMPVTDFNGDIVVETTLLPLPFTATMDQGTNIATGGGNTFYELGWDPLAPGTGFPTAGTLLTAPLTLTPFQIASSYQQPMSALVDASHVTANLTPSNPQPCVAVSLLSSGGGIFVNRQMTDLCIFEYADGSTQTNQLLEYDWFENTVPAVYTANGRVNFSSGRALNRVNSGDPVLFETQFATVNTASPITNIMFQYVQAPTANATTFLLALSALPTEQPTITCPSNIEVGCSTDLLVPVNFAAAATDGCDTNPTISYSLASGSGFPIGSTIVTATSRNASGGQAACSFTVTRAALGFAGFLPPLGGADAVGGSFAHPLRSFEHSSEIPVKFMAQCGGSPVVSGQHRLEVIPYADAHTPGTPIPAVSKDKGGNGNLFRLSGHHWQFNLWPKATGMTPGLWLLRATLSDGSQHTAWIRIGEDESHREGDHDGGKRGDGDKGNKGDKDSDGHDAPPGKAHGKK